jgi:hypothetical protein
VSIARAMPAVSALATTSMVIEAARSWRAARDTGYPVQPALYAPLETRGCGMLAPTLDGLLTLFEAGFRRRFQAGDPLDRGLTGDEHQLLDLLAEDEPPAAAEQVRPGLATAMLIALRSTRIMLRSVARQQADNQSPPGSEPLFFTQAVDERMSEPAQVRHAEEPGREDRISIGASRA